MSYFFRFLVSAIFFILCAFVIPIFPDEISVIEHAIVLRETGSYNFHWPPVLVLLAYFNPFLDYGPIAQRFIHLILFFPLLHFIIRGKLHTIPTLICLFSLPYLALCVSTASPQGLMVAFIGLIMFLPDIRIIIGGFLLSLAYASNPVLILIAPISLIASVLFKGAAFKYLMMIATSIILFVPWIYWCYIQTGEIHLTLSTNGPLNLFLGNNPDPLSHRGVGNYVDVVQLYSLTEDVSYTTLVLEYISRDTYGFLTNLLYKALLFFSPLDHIRSGIGVDLMGIVFVYFFLVQVLVYCCFLMFTKGVRFEKYFALYMMAAAFLVYTIFFVKVRFRIPFDVFLFFSYVIGLKQGYEQKTPCWYKSDK